VIGLWTTQDHDSILAMNNARAGLRDGSPMNEAQGTVNPGCCYRRVFSLRLQEAHSVISSVPSSQWITVISALQQIGQIMVKHSLKPRSWPKRIVESVENIMIRLYHENELSAEST